MAQDKTFVPGMENDGPVPGLYSRSSANHTMKGTFVPGMQEFADANVEPTRATPKATATRESNTPVVGFLYSISRKGIGEYWPIKLGTNTIGRSAENDVQLKEMSVSDHHAVLAVKQMKTTKKLIATVCDKGSKNGMWLNDEELDYDNHACNNGDILTIGTSYQLLVMLVNAPDYGLKVAENFVPFEDVVEEPDPEPTAPASIYGRSSGRRYEGGTVDLSGQNMFDDEGGTQIL